MLSCRVECESSAHHCLDIRTRRVVLGLLGNPVYRVGRLLELWLGEQTPKRLCIVLVGMQQPIQPTVQQASGLKLALLEIIPPKLDCVNFQSFPEQTPRISILQSKRMMHLGQTNSTTNNSSFGTILGELGALARNPLWAVLVAARVPVSHRKGAKDAKGNSCVRHVPGNFFTRNR